MYVLLLNFTIMAIRLPSNVESFAKKHNLNLSNQSESIGEFFSGLFSNLWNKFTGSGLTGAEREANAFTAAREDLAWNRQMEASNTAFQRQVADMQAAGINPMLAASGNGGSSVPSAQAQASVTPSDNVGDLLSLIAALSSQNVQRSLGERDLDIKERVADAEIANKEADTNLKSQQESESKERERGARIVNDIKEATKDLEIEAAQLRNNISRAEEKQIYSLVDKCAQDIRESIARTDTEETKQMLNKAAARLDDMKAYEIIQMLPYAQALAEAQTEEAKATAALASVKAFYEQKLIDGGYIDSLLKTAAADANITMSEEQMRAWDAALKSGDYSKVEPNAPFLERVAQQCVTALHRVSTYVLPMGASTSYRSSSTQVNK